MSSVPQAKIDEVKRLPEYYVAPYFGTYFYRFNVGKEPFAGESGKLVRRAFSLAVDKKQLTEQVLRTGERPTGAFCPPVIGYEPVKGLTYDREQARKLFAQAGYGANGKPFPAIDILYNTEARHKAIAEALAQQWKDVLGVQVGLRNSDWKSYLADMEHLNYTMLRSSWIGDYADPNTFLDMFVTDGGNNRTGWSNARYDQLLAIAQREGDNSKRFAAYREMEAILTEDECPILPLYYYVSQGLMSDQVRGLWPNIRDLHPLQYVWMEE